MKNVPLLIAFLNVFIVGLSHAQIPVSEGPQDLPRLVQEASEAIVSQQIAKGVESLTGQAVESVRKTGMANLYEVVTPRGLIYADSTGQFVIFGGTIVDSNTKENLSAKRLAEISKFNWNELPLADAIMIVRGNGKRVIATVEDPNCGYCKKFASELNKLNNVSIYTFVVPMLGSDSLRKANAIWCSADRRAAWEKQMQGTFAVEGNPKCETPSGKLVDWVQKMRVQGTPTVLFTDGTRLPGFTTADALEKKLKQVYRD